MFRRIVAKTSIRTGYDDNFAGEIHFGDRRRSVLLRYKGFPFWSFYKGHCHQELFGLDWGELVLRVKQYSERGDREVESR